MVYASKSDVGRLRELNEDLCSAFYSVESECDFFVLADGMGGHNCGEVASSIAIESITEYLIEQPMNDDERFDGILMDAIQCANQKIVFKQNEDDSCNGMGTTVVVAAIKNNIAHIVHAGDTRAYLYRKKELSQITVDHSYISELVKIGYLTEEEASEHPSKNIITQALGNSDGVSPDVNIVKLKVNDYLIICSDGLYNMVSDEEICRIIDAFIKPDEICEVLVEQANENGGEDNISVIVVKI